MNRNLLISINFTDVNNYLINKNKIFKCVITLDKPEEFITYRALQSILNASIEHIKENYQPFSTFKIHVVITMNYVYRPEEVFTVAFPICRMNNINKTVHQLVENLQELILDNYNSVEIPEDLIPEEPEPIIVKEEVKSNIKKYTL